MKMVNGLYINIFNNFVSYAISFYAFVDETLDVRWCVNVGKRQQTKYILLIYFQNNKCQAQAQTNQLTTGTAN